MLMDATDTKLPQICEKGGGPALNDVIAGHIDVYCDPATRPTPDMPSKTSKGYATTSKTRVATLPDVPISAGAGVPAFDATTWYGLYALHGTPRPMCRRAAHQLPSQAGFVSDFRRSLSAGWGGRDRTSEWRNQNLFDYPTISRRV